MAASDTSALTGFHVSRDARDFYKFQDEFFAYRGKAQIPNFQTARGFANEMNQKRDIVSDPAQIVQASAVNAVALIHGIQQYILRLYLNRHPGALSRALNQVEAQIGEATQKTLDTFVQRFPPQPIYHNTMTPYEYMMALYDARPNREATLEELLMLWLSNANPAFKPFLEIFGDEKLRTQTAYAQLTASLNQYFSQIAQSDPGDGLFPAGQNIIDLLLEPIRRAPDSLDQQLQILLESWRGTLDESLIMRLMTVIDAIKEDYRFLFGGGGAPPDFVPGASMQVLTAAEMAAGAEFEPEAFTLDREWMPNLVLMAKNAYVWLDQLSKKYGQELIRLDQIPDAELDQLAKWGFTGLWLIGLWERSEASKRIKHLSGNPDAVASAYSLWDYQIAQRLGGEEGLQDLRARAWKRGIRLASDMVPNHVGIDGKWVVEHPEYFVSLDYSPYPNYTFNGPDLSTDSRVGIFLEDHYYDRSDAAVVFKRVDRHTGSVKYIYHGNDGTTMPWNDTAQLNYLNAQVREAMIQLIIDIARRFPVIRFDAAMTLVKRHVQRLWWPEPGSGSGISSRAQFGITKSHFDRLMPEEFWREVVDRAAVEAPDTLLLAEAFWMMEGYFVRSLGMHRVYNSAFMNMLRDEENAKYRSLMKNTLEFDPEVLRRYVNFLNNPDEKTAVEQFGKGDKYFGVTMLMLTMPGLPMFGHGQVEGFSEKYGMEYYRAYYDETPDGWLIERHERELFPIVKKRYLFAGVENFLLYDFDTMGGIDENVYTYSNRRGDERTIVAYNNRYHSTAGWIRNSVAFSIKIDGTEERALTRRTLGDGMAIAPEPDLFVTFRDIRSGLEYIRNVQELVDRGLYVELGGYQYVLFLDFKVVRDTAGYYRRLAESLGGRGTQNLNDALQEMIMEPVLTPFRALMNGETINQLIAFRTEPDAELLDQVQEKITAVIDAVASYTGTAGEPDTESTESETGDTEPKTTPPTPAEIVREKLQKVLMLPLQETPAIPSALFADSDEDKALQSQLIVWALLCTFGDDPAQTRAWIDEWLLGKIVVAALRETGMDDYGAGRILTTVKLAVARKTLLSGTETEKPDEAIYALLGDTDARQLLNVNTFNSVTYYDKQGFETLLRWLVIAAQVDGTPEALEQRYKTVEALITANETAEYQVNKLREALKPKPATPKPAVKPAAKTPAK